MSEQLSNLLSRKFLGLLVVNVAGYMLARDGLLDSTTAIFVASTYAAYCGGNVGEHMAEAKKVLRGRENV